MAFTFYQTPNRLTPANAEHIYTIGSDLSGESSYKYVIKIVAFPYNWIDADTYIIAKIKARPNSEGRIIFDAQKIVQSMLNPNIRVDWDDYLETDLKMYRGQIPQGGDTGEDSYFVSKPTLSEAFSRANANNNTENLGPFEAEAGQESKYHIMEYRIMVGEEYYDSLGNLVENIPPDTSAKFTPVLDEYVSPSTVGSWPATYPSVEFVGFLGDTRLGTLMGINFHHTTSGGTTIQNNDIPLPEGITETTNLPSSGDKLIITSLYTDTVTEFVWTETEVPGQPSGWIFVSRTQTLPYIYGQFQPESILTWVGAQNRLQEDIYLPIASNFENINGHLYDSSRWYMHAKQSDVDPPIHGKFLNIAGPSVEKNYIGAGNIPTRTRSIYRGEPVMASFFNGMCFDFLNDLRVVTFRWHTKNQAPNTFNFDLEYIINNHGAGPLDVVSDPYPNFVEGNTLGNKLLHFTKNDIWPLWNDNDPMEWFEINTWQYEQDPNDGNPQGYDESASEILRYEVKDVTCFNNPTYFVFLNRNGAWDTFTFGAKSVKSYDIDRKTYTKSPYRNSTIYSKQSFDQSKVVYENNITVGLTCETEFLKEYDSVIVEDLIRSSEVYIVEDIFVNDNTETVSPKLIPVTVNTSSVEEYQNRYEKLFQHVIEVEFNNIEGYNQSK